MEVNSNNDINKSNTNNNDQYSKEYNNNNNKKEFSHENIISTQSEVNNNNEMNNSNKNESSVKSVLSYVLGLKNNGAIIMINIARKTIIITMIRSRKEIIIRK